MTTEQQTTETPTPTTQEQVGNLLNVVRQHHGQFVLKRNRRPCYHINPLMSDGGIQPPGEPLYGPLLFNSREAAEAYAASLNSKPPREFSAETYVGGLPYAATCNSAGQWGVGHNFVSRYGASARDPFELVSGTREDAEQEARRQNEESIRPVYGVLSVEDWALDTRLYDSELTAREALAAHPQWSDAPHEPLENMPDHWVLRLDPDEPVDVALDIRGDGTSADCFITTAGALIAAGYGQMAFERTDCGVTVYADTRKQFRRLAEACE